MANIYQDLISTMKQSTNEYYNMRMILKVDNLFVV